MARVSTPIQAVHAYMCVCYAPLDQTCVLQIGSKWKDVASKCIRGHYQPLLIFYTNPEGTHISSEDAPRHTTMCPRYRTNGVNGEIAGNASGPSSQGPPVHSALVHARWPVMSRLRHHRTVHLLHISLHIYKH